MSAQNVRYRKKKAQNGCREDLRSGGLPGRPAPSRRGVAALADLSERDGVVDLDPAFTSPPIIVPDIIPDDLQAAGDSIEIGMLFVDPSLCSV